MYHNAVMPFLRFAMSMNANSGIFRKAFLIQRERLAKLSKE